MGLRPSASHRGPQTGMIPRTGCLRPDRRKGVDRGLPVSERVPAAHAVSSHDFPIRNVDLAYRIRGLPMAGAVLHLGSHPDDEEAGLMAYLSRGLGARTVYWSATRGEGGQNRTGPERGEALSVIRTWESLDARALDGGEVLYGPFYDFGFSRSGEDALSRWDRRAVVREIVRAIRLVQPLVLISRWRGGPEDGHGHHQAIGLAVAEAFDAARDPTAFPELRGAGLRPWQPRKLYRSAIGDWQPGEDVTFGDRLPDLEHGGVLRINTGAFDPISGRSYQELAWIGVNKHQSQAMGFLPVRGDYFSYYRLDRSLVEARAPEQGVFDGLDPTLSGLPEHAGSAVPGLPEVLQEARGHAQAAAAAFRPDHPAEAGRSVLEGLAALRRAREAAAHGEPHEDVRTALDRALARKIRDFEEAAARCLGIDVECLIDEARLTPGKQVRVTARLWNGTGQAVEGADVNLDVPRGWPAPRAEALTVERQDAQFSPTLAEAFHVTVPVDAALSSPYWLREPPGPYRYAWTEDAPLGLAFDEPLISATCRLGIGPHEISITRPAMHRDTFVGGSRELAPAVVPPVALRPKERRRLLPASDREGHVELELAARSMRDAVIGTLRAEAPAGWGVHPAMSHLSFERVGRVHTVRFEVAIPADAKPGIHEIGYRIESDDRDYDIVLQPVRRRAPGLAGPVDETNCVAETFVLAPAAVSIHLIEAEFVKRLRSAYIRGADEDILGSLLPFGIDMTVLAPDELSYADLSLFDVIVVGPNAYLISDDVRRNAARLLEYVERGGTLVCQYQAYGYQQPGFAPYPFRYRQPHDRVTSPDAPVTLLDPQHPALSVPNRIGPEDFDGWVHDRGLYFFGEWDKRYTPLLESGDPGYDPQRGGLLVANYGRGTYVYAAYSFFRQIPQGVPGAVRLFANLLGLAEARILERAEQARHIPMLAFLSGEQLYDVARLMSERWLDAGTLLCRQGDRGTDLYMVLEGEIEVIKGEAGAENIVSVAGHGDVVGELAAIADIPRSATLRAGTDVKILVMRGTHFRAFLRQHADLAERIRALLAQRLASAEIRW
jgi:LmbE family N-acetylglucosaminyl deacetylase